MSEYKDCPFCSEQILARAIKCKHCQSMLENNPEIKPSRPGVSGKDPGISASTEEQAPPSVEKDSAAPESTAAEPPETQAAAPAASPPPLPNKRKKKSPLKKLLIILGSIAAFALIAIFGLLALSMSIIRSSEPFSQAVTAVQGNPQAMMLLGAPIKTGFLVTGSVSTSGISGEAEFSIPVSGSLDRGTIYVEAGMAAGQWSFSLLELVSSEGERINLLHGTSSQPLKPPGSDQTQSQMKLFAEAGYGYTVSYPQHWHYEKSGNAVIFSGPPETDEYYTTINILIVFSREAGGNYDNLEELLLDLKGQFENAGGEIFKLAEETIDFNGTLHPAITYEASYQIDGEDLWQWALLLQRDSQVFYQFSYTAPVDLAELSEDVLVEMLDSFTLTGF